MCINSDSLTFSTQPLKNIIFTSAFLGTGKSNKSSDGFPCLVDEHAWHTEIRATTNQVVALFL